MRPQTARDALLACPLWIGLLTGTTTAAELHVDALNGDDVTGDGSETAPFRTIGTGLAAAAAGDTVLVAPGIYNQALGEAFPLKPPLGCTVQGADARLTIVSGDGAGTLFELVDENCLSDLTIRRGDVGVYSFQKHLEIRYLRRCILEHNDVAIHYSDFIHSDSGFVVVNSAIHHNGIAVRHQSDFCDFNSVTLSLYGSTVTENGVFVEHTGGGCERFVAVFKSILRGNGSDLIAGFTWDLGVMANVLSDPAYVGVDLNVDVDPQWVEATAGDLHLEPTTPIFNSPAPPMPWPPDVQWVGTGLWIWEDTFMEIDDLDGDRRHLSVGIEPGCDEVRLPTLYVTGSTKVGQVLNLRSQAAPSSALLVYLGLDVYAAPVMGFLWIQPPYVNFGTWVQSPEGTDGLALPIPTAPPLAGIDVYFQGFQPAGGTYASTHARWVRILP